MSDHPMYEGATKTNHSFPVMIALTALVLALTSGVVNYRQNHLANLESSLRDTRDQLQLAKNDITDIKLKTIKQLVDADFAIKNEQQLKQDKRRLHNNLVDANTRISELENQVRSMDHKLVRALAALKALKKKAQSKKKQKIRAKTTANKPKKNHAQVASPKALVRPASANLDIYLQKIPTSMQRQLKTDLSRLGFKPRFPANTPTTSLSQVTTVFYYDGSYKGVAEQLVKALVAITHRQVPLRKGASPFAKNKIIAHMIGR